MYYGLLLSEPELSVGRVDPRVGSGRVGSGRVGSWKLASAVGRVGSNFYACQFFVMSRYFEGIYGMADDNCIIILDG